MTIVCFQKQKLGLIKKERLASCERLCAGWLMVGREGGVWVHGRRHLHGQSMMSARPS